jgi:hypothetical protein
VPTHLDLHVRLVWLHLSTPPNLDPNKLPRGSQIVHQTRRTPCCEDGKSDLVTVGSSSPSSSCGLILRIGNESECWDLNDRGACVIFASVVLETEAVAEGDSVWEVEKGQIESPPTRFEESGLSYLKQVSYSVFIVGEA